jgi:hypothetical protein
MNESEEKERLEKYINEQGLGVVFQLLIYQIKISEARSHLIRETSKSLNLMLSNNPSNQKDALLNIQTIQLDLISKLFMFMEDYLSYSYYLRISKNKLHLKILSYDNVVWKEIEYLKGLDEDGIRKYLLLPEVENLSLLDIDKQFVKDTLRSFVTDIYERIKEITSFYENYNRVYIKYKHIFSSLIGTIYKDEKDGLEIPRIFLRDMNKKKVRSTYILSTDNNNF